MTPDTVRRFAARGAFLTALALVVVLAAQLRSIRARYADLARRLREPHAGMYVPTFRTRSLRGDSVTVGQSAGRRQVLFVFTTTCPYCRASLPAWRRIAASAEADHSIRVDVLGITLSPIDSTRLYVAENGLTFPIITFPEHKLEFVYHVQTVPATVVLDSAGRVLYGHVGAVTDSSVVDSVRKAMWMAPPTTAKRLPPRQS